MVNDQKTIEWEVCKFYWKLYRKQEVRIDKEYVRKVVEHMKKIAQNEKSQFDEKITMNEVSTCLRNTRNNVAPGCGGFTETF